MAKKTKTKFPSELRFDIASEDWVVIATGRAKKPDSFKKDKKEKKKGSSKDCPFCKIKSQKEPTLMSAKGKISPYKSWKKLPDNWTAVSIPNKFPALLPFPELAKKEEGGIYKRMNAAGFHEVVITRDHEKSLGQFSVEEAKEVIDVYQSRYLELMKKKFVNHVSIFHNHGPKAGASMAHPHSQIITTPLIDIDLSSALSNAKEYYRRKKKCIYCKMTNWERKVKKRIVFENKSFLVVCPFASKTAFEVIVSPKKHSSHFEEIKEGEKWELAEAFQTVLNKIYKGLNNPDYNFYLHTAPCDGKRHDYYHWHFTILPKTAISAGFEMGTQIEISTIEPEKAAEYLRKQ